MHIGKAVVVASLIALVGLATSSSAIGADTFARTTYITFSKPVRLPGVVLGSGTYIFELPDPISAWDVVSVLSRDRQRVYYTGLTRPIVRPAGLPPDQVVSLGEAPADAAVPIRVWWPIGERTGREFNYSARR
jgi:hypothetical protein